ncbi:MAG: imm11 family protein [Stenotrophomonas sp.]|uniref:imm11 family protein n=1 Tax=Stenotrophomonas sp. TaxID=69392 RepID=UPI003D6D0028
MNDRTAIPVSVDTDTHRGEFFVITSSFWGNGQFPGLEIANEEALVSPGMQGVAPPTGEPDQYPERPHLVHVPEKGGMPRDFEELAGIWIVSQALKDVFASVDQDAFAFVACDFTLADGSPGPQYYFCDVIRTVDALDVPASRVKVKVDHNFITGQDEPFYSILGGASLVFNKERVRGAHIFRQPNSGLDPICDRVMFDALAQAHLTGVDLKDAYAL